MRETTAVSTTVRPLVARTTAGAAIVLLIAGCGAAATTVASDWRSVRPVMPNDELPAFTLRSLDGAVLDRNALSGRVALFDFWATWCPSCVAGMPTLQKLDAELKASGLTVVSVNTEADNVDEVRRFAAEHRFAFPVYLDDGALQNRFQVQTLPTLVIADKSGRVRDVLIGAFSEAGVRRAVEPLLALDH